jgi:hypothetical protein
MWLAVAAPRWGSVNILTPVPWKIHHQISNGTLLKRKHEATLSVPALETGSRVLDPDPRKLQSLGIILCRGQYDPRYVPLQWMSLRPALHVPNREVTVSA